jgi:large subunit ribosomal protein L16
MYKIPDKLKYKKYIKSCSLPPIKKFENRVISLSDGYCVGIVALEKGRLTQSQMEACFKVITKTIKGDKRLKKGVIKSNFNLTVPVTKKSTGVRMGKGKGNVNSWVFPVSCGRVLFELKDVDIQVGLLGLRQAQYRLPFLTKLIFRIK